MGGGGGEGLRICDKYPNLFILMDYPIHISTISMELFILYFKGSQVEIFKFSLFLSLKIFFIANSADPDEMLPYAPFHLGLHCLATYLFTGIVFLFWFFISQSTIFSHVGMALPGMN